MAKYQAKPVKVEAFVIYSVIRKRIFSARRRMKTEFCIMLENGKRVIATLGMVVPMPPVAGDYWIIQDDGYMPKKVFERKHCQVLK